MTGIAGRHAVAACMFQTRKLHRADVTSLSAPCPCPCSCPCPEVHSASARCITPSLSQRCSLHILTCCAFNRLLSRQCTSCRTSPHPALPLALLRAPCIIATLHALNPERKPRNSTKQPKAALPASRQSCPRVAPFPLPPRLCPAHTRARTLDQRMQRHASHVACAGCCQWLLPWC